MDTRVIAGEWKLLLVPRGHTWEWKCLLIPRETEYRVGRPIVSFNASRKSERRVFWGCRNLCSSKRNSCEKCRILGHVAFNAPTHAWESTLLLAGIWKFRLKRFGARIGTLEFQEKLHRVPTLRDRFDYI